MENTSPARTIIDTLITYRKWWLAPTLVCTLLALAYVLVGSKTYTSRQSLVVRDDLVGTHFKPGRFDSLDSLKSAQETILEISRRPQVVRNALSKLGPPALTSESAWLGDQNLEATQGKIQISAPNGAEFGRTEVIVLSVQQNTRERAGQFVSYLLDEVEDTLRELRSAQFGSMQEELDQAASTAEKSYLEAANELKSFERKIGADLSTLISLNDAQAGTNNLQSELANLSVEQRVAWADVENVLKQIQILKEITDQPESLLEVPQELLQLQPTLSSLARGLNDAVLAYSRSKGRYQMEHPRVREDHRSVQDIKQRIEEKLTRTLGSLQNQLELREGKYNRITQLIDQKKQRLGELSSLRVDYTTLRQKVAKRREIHAGTQSSLAEIVTLGTSAKKVSLISRIDMPQTELYADGPSNKVVVFGGMLAGLLIGLGLVMFVAPYGNEDSPELVSKPETTGPQSPSNNNFHPENNSADTRTGDYAVKAGFASNSVNSISEAIRREQNASPQASSASVTEEQPQSQSSTLEQQTSNHDQNQSEPVASDTNSLPVLNQEPTQGLTKHPSTSDFAAPEATEITTSATDAEIEELKKAIALQTSNPLDVATSEQEPINDRDQSINDAIATSDEQNATEPALATPAESSDPETSGIQAYEFDSKSADEIAAELSGMVPDSTSIDEQAVSSVDQKLDQFFSDEADELGKENSDYDSLIEAAEKTTADYLAEGQKEFESNPQQPLESATTANEIAIPEVDINHIIENTGSGFNFDEKDSPVQEDSTTQDLVEAEHSSDFELADTAEQDQDYNTLYNEGSARIIENTGSGFNFDENDSPVQEDSTPLDLVEAEHSSDFELADTDQNYNTLYNDGSARILESANPDDSNHSQALSSLHRGKIDHRILTEKLNQLHQAEPNSEYAGEKSDSAMEREQNAVVDATDSPFDQQQPVVPPLTTSIDSSALENDGDESAPATGDEPDDRPKATTVDLRMLKEQLASRMDSKPLSDILSQDDLGIPDVQSDPPIDESIAELADSIREICQRNDGSAKS